VVIVVALAIVLVVLFVLCRCEAGKGVGRSGATRPAKARIKGRSEPSVTTLAQVIAL
jgi:hypothetical protein